MNWVGVDTASFLIRLDPGTATRVARVLPQERLTKGRSGSTHYGNFGDWAATLYARRSDQFGQSSLVLTASLPRLLYGENSRPVGTVGAEQARITLFDRLEALADVSLHAAPMTICRVDFCATLVPFRTTRAVIASAAAVELPRRERAAMSNGVAFFYSDKRCKDTIYDKQTELGHTIAKLTSRLHRSTPPDAVAGRLAALRRAERRLAHGAIRLECRLTSGKQISSRLTTPAERKSQVHPEPTPARVLTTANAELVVGRFRDQLQSRIPTHGELEAVEILLLALGPVRAQRAFALLSLSELTGSLTVAAASLGISRDAAVRLAESARSAGVARIERATAERKVGLALPDISGARTDELERRLQSKWQRTQPTTQTWHSFSLTLGD